MRGPNWLLIVLRKWNCTTVSKTWVLHTRKSVRNFCFFFSYFHRISINSKGNCALGKQIACVYEHENIQFYEVAASTFEVPSNIDISKENDNVDIPPPKKIYEEHLKSFLDQNEEFARLKNGTKTVVLVDNIVTVNDTFFIFCNEHRQPSFINTRPSAIMGTSFFLLIFYYDQTKRIEFVKKIDSVRKIFQWYVFIF